jgi:uncharacterized protein (TIGR02594 family)
MPTIAQVQKALLELGYDLGDGGVDGIVGRYTIAAVKQLQKDKGLNVKWPGTIGPKTIKALGLPGDEVEPGVVPDGTTPPWIILARKKIGLHETINNKTLKDWLKSDGNTLGDPAKNPWCGDFMETVIAITLPDEPMITNPYWALNWKKFGISIDLVALGAVAPFKRPGGGHIGIVVGHETGYFHILGGNQSNAISIMKIDKDRLSGPLRWPSTYPKPKTELPHSTIDATVSHNES